MPRPRKPLSYTMPEIAQAASAVTWADMGAQIIEQTWAGGTPGGVYAVLHSFKTSNVIMEFIPTKGYSASVGWYEASDPTVSNVFLGINTYNDTGVIAGRQVFGRLIITQRA